MKNQFKSDIIKFSRKIGCHKEIDIMRKLSLTLAALLLLFSLTACSEKETVKEAGLAIAKDGAVTCVLRDSFEKDFYDLKDLEDMIRLEVSAYNQTKGGQGIELESLELIDRDCVAVMKYTSYEDYASFSEVPFFVGTVKEAVAAGMDLNVTLTEPGKENTVGKEELEALADYFLVVWYGDLPVSVPGKIRYCSEELRVLNSKKAIPPKAAGETAENTGEPAGDEAAGPFYLLYK